MKVCPKCGNRVYGNYKLCRACRVKEPKLYKQPMREMKVVKCVKCGDYFNTSQSSVGRKKEVCKSCQRPTGSENYIIKLRAKDKEIAKLKNEIEVLKRKLKNQ